MRKRPMTNQSINFIRRNHETMSVQEIADRLHRPYGQVYNWMWKRGMIDVRQTDYSKPPFTTILRMYTEGWYIEDIADEVGESCNFCANVIYRVFRTYTVPRRAGLFVEEPDSYIAKERETE